MATAVDDSDAHRFVVSAAASASSFRDRSWAELPRRMAAHDVLIRRRR